MLDEALAIESLGKCALFAHVEEPELNTVVGSLRRRRFRRNEVIFHQGDLGDALHIITSGSVKILLPSPEGEEAIIATLRTGDFFGELALLDGAPRSATATALDTTETLTLPRDVFLRLLAEDPKLTQALMAGLAAELRRLTGHVEELHFFDLAGRLAMQLARLARASGDGSGRVELDWPYTQSDLAAMIGGTRQSVNKLLSSFVDQGLIEMGRETLIITDVDELERSGAR